ncbi:MAG: calcium/sodium antiporter [Actinobacteria bacterium]|nr:calcium/sodium antiporter [Actinomycetota bacterium]
MPIALALFVGGLIALTLAADRFVLSAARLSRALGLSPLLIGALVIGLGTSAPEMLVSALASGRGEVDIAVGNVIGSNTANLSLVLGSTALVATIVSKASTIIREGALMMVSMAIATLLLWNLQITRIEAVFLLAGMAAAAILLVRWARRDPEIIPEPRDGEVRVGVEVLVGLGALSLTLLGAELLVRGASRMALELGISSAFVGLIIVSVGTSLPELATALAAARRQETDLVLGNLVGSNLFNTLAVLGLAGMVGPGAVSEEFRGALVYMLVVGAVAGGFVLMGRKLQRWQGAVLLALFMGFVALTA